MSEYTFNIADYRGLPTKPVFMNRSSRGLVLLTQTREGSLEAMKNLRVVELRATDRWKSRHAIDEPLRMSHRSRVVSFSNESHRKVATIGSVQEADSAVGPDDLPPAA